MAKQKAGYLGGFQGTLGPAIGYMWNGKWCMRTRPTSVRNPRTPEQVAQRELFKREVQLAADLGDAVVPSMRAMAREMGMTSYNLFVKVNQQAFSMVGGEFTVDWRHLRLSMGDVPVVESPSMTLTADDVLEISYAKGRGYSHDQVYAVVYAPGMQSCIVSYPAYRREGRIAVALPDPMAGEELQVWLMVQDPDGQWSESIWVPGNEGEGVENEALGMEREGQLNVKGEALGAGKEGYTPTPAATTGLPPLAVP